LVGDYLCKYALICGRDLGDGEVIKVFAEALEDIEPRRLKAALEEYLKTGEKFPWPSDIRALSEL
jgi:hypothetical protein